MKILVTGGNGQLGRCFADVNPQPGTQIIVLGRQQLDVCNEGQIASVLDRIAPDALINAAAYTAVDRAETERDAAMAVNALAPALLADACANRNTRLLQISTDYVFDGSKLSGYSETDRPNPLGTYGKSKLAGEHAVLHSAANASVMRTAWVFSEYGNNFVKTMIRLAGERDSLGIVSDQVGCPTYAGHLALAAIDWVQRPADAWAATPITHYVDLPATSWSNFAIEIFSQALARRLIDKIPDVNPILTEAYPTPAKRPMNSVLLSSTFQQRDWKAGLAYVTERLAS